MVKAGRIIGDMLADVTREKMGMRPRYYARELMDDTDIVEARKLAVEQFAERDKITKEEILSLIHI